MTITQPFQVYRFTMGSFDDPPLATFAVREKAFDYARQFAIENKCDMLVIGAQPEPEGKDVLF